VLLKVERPKSKCDEQTISIIIQTVINFIKNAIAELNETKQINYYLAYFPMLSKQIVLH
jgi:hypothetical protein